MCIRDSYMYGGESGIRTHVRVSPKHAFQACAFSHSAISPARIIEKQCERKRREHCFPYDCTEFSGGQQPRQHLALGTWHLAVSSRLSAISLQLSALSSQLSANHALIQNE